MPIYVFYCKNKKCNKHFEVLCKFDEIKDVRCTHCNSKKVENQITAPNLAFAQPHESSKWDKFNYRAESLMERGKAHRRFAEENSHVGPNPYSEINDIDKGEGIDL